MKKIVWSFLFVFSSATCLSQEKSITVAKDGTGNFTTVQQAIDAGDPAYAEDARFFLGKALLQSRDVEAVRAEIERVVALNAKRAREAGEMIAAIDKLPPA